DTLCDRSVAWGSHVRATYRGVRRGEECGGEVREPWRIRVGVMVDVRDNVARRGGEARVARAREASVFSLDHSAVVLAGDGGGRVGGSIVHHDDLVVGIGESLQSLQTVANRAPTVVCAHDHGDPRPWQCRREWHLGERFAYRVQGGLGGSFDGGKG